LHIYIYGEKSFKKTIHDALEHGNVKFHLDENGTIQEINSLEALKLTIENEPDNIYLIDHEKIIDKKSLNSKIKFLTPKDGIEKEFLDQHGIEDIAIDDIKDLPKYIIKKLDALHLTDTFDEEDDEDIDNITKQEDDMASISDDEINAISGILDDIENIEEEEDFDLGDDLKDLLTSDDAQDNIQDDTQDDDIDEVMNIDIEDSPIENVEEHSIEENISEIMDIDIQNNDQGSQIMEEISELDNLNEDDMLAALSGVDSSTTSTKEKSEPINIDASNVNDLSTLLTQLLNNKTLEITVKIKD
jgi:hypothetical protein